MDYLGAQTKRPFQQRLNIAHLNCKSFGPKAREFVEKTNKIKPEKAALWFYMQNHAMAIFSQRFSKFEPLGASELALVNHYYNSMNKESLRMFFYLLLICTRETRHIKNLSVIGPKMTKKYGNAKFRKFTQSIKGGGSTHAVDAFYAAAPDVPLGDYCSYMYDLFNEGSWGGGYGGEAWADVAKVLKEFVNGEITAEMMMDTAFTLAHNNGPIFNKGLVFDMYDHTEIIRILDVQRSGQIPQYVAENWSTFVSDQMREYQSKVEALVGGEFGGYVDWFQVEALGAVKHYSSEKKTQETKYGLPMSVDLLAKAQESKAKMAAMLEAKTKFEPFPGVKLKKLTRAEL